MPHRSPPAATTERVTVSPSRVQRIFLAAAILCEAVWIALLVVLVFAK
jgi:hypothetical protein